MKFTSLCWIITVMLLGPAVAYAGNCRAVVVHKQVAVVEKVAAFVPAVVVPVVAKLVSYELPIYNTQFYQPTVPYAQAPYTAPYSAPVAHVQQPCPDNSAAFKQVATLLLQIDARLQKLEGVTQPPIVPPMPPMPPADPAKPPVDPFNPSAQPQQTGGQERLLTLASKHCASCHDKARAQASGKGFVLLEGGRFSASLSPESLGKMIDEVSSKRMPKGGTMTDAERLEFVSLLVSGK